MKDNTRAEELLTQDIIKPRFFEDLAEVEDIEIIQGAYFVQPTHYDKYEQILCAIDGTV